MTKYIKYTTAAFYLCLLFLCFVSCQKKENIKARQDKPEKTLSDREAAYPYNRIKVVHLYSDTVYVLTGEFTREAGEQLIIDEGTLIKGVYFTIKPGGIILANGSKNSPVVFTSRSLPGNQIGDINGALRIQGKSTDNSTSTVADPSDFSGTLKFVRLEFASLSLTAVGSRTIIENVMVSYAPSSSFAIRGGTFNARNLVSYACSGSGDYYITRGYTGRMQHLLAYRHPFFGNRGTDPQNALAGVFIENNPNVSIAENARPRTFPVISNLSVLGPDTLNGSPALFRDTSLSFRTAALITTAATGLRIRNSLLEGFPGAAWYLDDAVTANSLLNMQSDFRNSIVHGNYSNRIFYLKPGTFPPYPGSDFQNFMMNAQFNNRILYKVNEFKFRDLFNYDAPDVLPSDGSPVLTGADFTGPDYNDVFFNKVNYIGALGGDNWLEGWTNFTPLKTNYNFYR